MLFGMYSKNQVKKSRRETFPKRCHDKNAVHLKQQLSTCKWVIFLPASVPPLSAAEGKCLPILPTASKLLQNAELCHKLTALMAPRFLQALPITAYSFGRGAQQPPITEYSWDSSTGPRALYIKLTQNKIKIINSGTVIAVCTSHSKWSFSLESPTAIYEAGYQSPQDWLLLTATMGKTKSRRLIFLTLQKL